MKKSDKVLIIGSWDNKGKFYIQKATVRSFGKKQATMFIDSENDMAQERFYVEGLNQSCYSTHIVKDLTDKEAESFAMKLATGYLALEIDKFERYSKIDETSVQYNNHMKILTAEYKTLSPSIVWR